MEKTIKELLMEMSEEEVKYLLFEPDKYRPVWRFMETNAGHDAIPGFDSMKWCKRALALSELCGWTVDEYCLRVTFLRFDASKSKK